MGAARLIAIKDLKLRIRDRSALIIGIVAPLGLAFIFNLILGDLVEGSFAPEFAVVSEDGGDVAGGFIDMMEAIEDGGFIGLVPGVTNAAGAEELVETGAAAAAIVIPAGFSANVTSGQPATISVIGSPDNPVSSEIARSIVEGFAAEVRTSQLAVATALRANDEPPSPEELTAIAAAAIESAHPIGVGQIEADTKELDLPTFFAASMSVFFLFFTVSFGVNGLLEERNQGTIARLMAAPIKSSAIVTGKAMVSFVLGLVSMTVLIVASSVLLGASWGNPLGVALLVLAGVFSATGLMTAVAAFAKTPEQAGNLQAILAVGLGMLGGIFFPASLGTGLLANLAYISPHRWFLTGLGDLAGGGALSVVVPSLLGLIAFGAISWGLSAYKFRNGVSL